MQKNWFSKYILWQVLIAFTGCFFLLFAIWFGLQTGFLVSFSLGACTSIFPFWVKSQEYLNHSFVFLAERNFDFESAKRRIFLKLRNIESYEQETYKLFFKDLDFALYRKPTKNTFQNALNNKLKPHNVTIENHYLDGELSTIVGLDPNIYQIFKTIVLKHFPLLIWDFVPDPLLNFSSNNKAIVASSVGHSQWTVQLYLPLAWSSTDETPVNNFWRYMKTVLQANEKVIWQNIFCFGYRFKNYQQQFFLQREQQVFDQLSIKPKDKFSFFVNALYPRVDEIHKNQYAKRLLPSNILVPTSIRVMILCESSRYAALEKELEKAIYNYFWDCNLEKIFIASTNQVAFNEPRKSINQDIDFIHQRLVRFPGWILLFFRKLINLTYFLKENSFWRQKIMRSILLRDPQRAWPADFSILDSESLSGVFQFPKID
jgi:hypothetical protein